jgi:hypothetical protein
MSPLSLVGILSACGGVPEWLKGTGCKPVGFAYVGSNPTPSTSLDNDLPRSTGGKF